MEFENKMTSNESMFCHLIENQLELICEFNNSYADHCYQHYLPLTVHVYKTPDAVLRHGNMQSCGGASDAVQSQQQPLSETVQAARIAGAIYQHLADEREYLEAHGWPSARLVVDGWAVLLVAPEDQSMVA